jgi:hypothetical protein
MTDVLDHRYQDHVQARLDAAYALAGRHDPAHPKHAIYTGVFEELEEQGISLGDHPLPVEVHDPVNSPSHYTQGSIEAIDAIRSALGDAPFQDYCIGNALKYLFRWRHKNGLEDLRKAHWYVNKAVEANA